MKEEAQGQRLLVIDDGGLQTVIDMAMNIHLDRIAQLLREANQEPVVLELKATSSVCPLEVLGSAVGNYRGALSLAVERGIALVHADGWLAVLVAIRGEIDQRLVVTGLDPKELESALRAERGRPATAEG